MVGRKELKAVIKTKKGKGNIELKEIPEPIPKEKEVKIEVKAAGICGTDIHIYYDEYPNNPPVVLGHEVSGVIVDIGRDVTEYKVGDRVTSETFFYTCGKCRFCRSGRINLCPDRLSIGSGVNGAFAKYLVVPEKNLHKLPLNVSFEEGALSEPLACSIHAVSESAGICASDVVVISGPGPIGLLALQVARGEGAFAIICGTSGDEERLAVGKQVGADIAINVQEKDPLRIVREVSEGYGADVVVECAGVASSASQCLRLVRKGGKFIQMGLFGKPVQIDLEQVVYKELNMIGSFSHVSSCWRKATRLLEQKKVMLEPLISDKLPLNQWKKGFEKTERHQGLKLLLYP